MQTEIRNYLVVTGNYWAFTLTDGALRMLVVLHFHQLGYSPLQVATLFLFYEFFGIVTNLLGGWLGSRIGLNVTMQLGVALQILALLMLTRESAALTVPWVMTAQAISGIAKDLNKMSAKASVKLMTSENASSRLFHWVAVLTGSKNSLKGIGFFLGGLLLTVIGFQNAMLFMAAMLTIALAVTLWLLPKQLGRSKRKTKFSQIFSKSAAINWLSAARLFLFGARDIWFVVALPVFLADKLQWSFWQVGGYIAVWIIGYGIVQALTPRLLKQQIRHPDGGTALYWVLLLCFIPALIAAALYFEFQTSVVITLGLLVFGVVFAINSAVHSYLILAYSDHDGVSMNVGFYYMANAAGRLIGTLLSGLLYQSTGLIGCLIGSSMMLLIASLLSTRLTAYKTTVPESFL